jgi:hypothetical protein
VVIVCLLSMKPRFLLPRILEEQQSPLVRQLLDIIDQQAHLIEQMDEQVQQLKDEIARLKNQPPRPKIQPSRLEKKGSKKHKSSKGRRPGSAKRQKTAKLEIHDTQPIEPEYLPPGSAFRYYKDWVVQDIVLAPLNTRYRLKVYETPDGDYVAGKLPANLQDSHFGPALIRFILYQYYHCHVTQPLLLEQLHETGVDISAGHLNRLLIEEKDRFHLEKDQILATGLEVSRYINVDDTGARHQGKNGYCTHIGNELFCIFESTQSKSRINFLRLLRAGHSDYRLNIDAITYMQVNKLPQFALEPIIANLDHIFADDRQWNDFLTQKGIVTDRHVQIATEGALMGSVIEHGLCDNLAIISDDAGQFNILVHALCWVHAERLIAKIVPLTDEQKKDLNTVRDKIWKLYEGLKRYKQNPRTKAKVRLQAKFDQIFTMKTSSATLNQALKRLHKNKSELLMVLERPEIPLHNNGAENAIREYVKKRKISGSTRSEAGRRCRDTFTSLKKTCRKLGISFWQYLKDRIDKINLIPDLSDLIRQQALQPG